MSHDNACITMITPDHNNPENETEKPASVVQTLGDLRAFITRCDLKDQKKDQIRSAIKRADELIGHGALDLPADAAKIMARLGQLSPAMAQMSKGAFANFKSRVRMAFRLAKTKLVTSTVRAPLSPPWCVFQSELATPDLRTTSRFVHFANGQGWTPHDVTDAHLERFATYLRDDALIIQWDDVVRGTIRSWNRISVSEPALGLAPLTAPQPKRTPYWIDPNTFPDGLKVDIANFVSDIANPPLFTTRLKQGHVRRRDHRKTPVRRKVTPKTVEQYRFSIITMVSALVQNGHDLASISSLAVLIAPANLDQILSFLHRRANENVTRYMLTIVVRARRIAEWCELAEAQLAQLDQLVAAVVEEGPRRRGMTAKNKALLDRLDDQKFRDMIYLIPGMLAERAKANSKRAWAANTFRTALAIELLLVCGVRRENLVSLELDRSIRKIGMGKNAIWVVEIAEEDVKNEEPLRFHLPQESADLLETYLLHWRPLLCAKPTAWLFPNSDGEMIDERTMTGSIQRTTTRILGVPVSTHQFRHISAELYLYANPEGLSTVSQHLGHRDFNTTRTYYARKRQRDASRRYQERVIIDRAEAARRTRRRK